MKLGIILIIGILFLTDIQAQGSERWISNKEYAEKFWTLLGLNNMCFGTNEPIAGPIATLWRDSDGGGILKDISDQFGPAYLRTRLSHV